MAMLVVISPAKKLDFETPCSWKSSSKPQFLAKSNHLVQKLQKLTPEKISSLMKLSPTLAQLNYHRFQSFQEQYNTDMAKQAAFAFNGDTYAGLQIHTFQASELKKAENNLRILSGLYGILKPHDLIQPYRLEMGTPFKFDHYRDLYTYWTEDVTSKINEDLKNHEYLVNCASQEYFKVIDKKILLKPIITPQFLDYKNGDYKMISFFAKKARGMMANYIVTNSIKQLKELKCFDIDGYAFNQKLTKSELQPVFTRKENAST